MKHSKIKKSQIVDKILFDFWGDGLNLLQLAQIDCQLIVDNPNAYFWVLSTVKDAWDKEAPISLDPSSFLKKMAQHLSDIFMCYMYVCTHPEMPLVIIRIQVFDLLPGHLTSRARSRAERPHITSHKPYFLAIPMNSPHVIHTPGNDVVSEVVMQVVESSLPRDSRNFLRLERSKSQKAVRSLKSMHILKGNSRFSNCMGAWTPYADGVADISPLAKFGTDPVVNGQLRLEQADSAKLRKEKLANIRFKGTGSGNLVSERLYDHVKSVKQKKRQNEVNDDDRRSRPRTDNKYRSIAPIRYAEFEIQEPLGDGNDQNDEHSHVVVKLVGNDVFAGLHELAVQENGDVVDPETLPGWLTGEEGLSCGVVKNGQFTPT